MGIFDRVVSEARKRGLVVTGVLGQSAKWASTFYKSNDPELWRNGAPRESQMQFWDNYVRRVVGRYKNDVHAWQVWEKTSADRFRSTQAAYRKFLLTAVQPHALQTPERLCMPQNRAD
jgi:GH35 family endo-1,4-beta-xylanase